VRYDEVVPTALAGERLDRLVAMVVGCSRAQAAVLVDEGAVTVGGTVCTSRSVKLAEGDEVVIEAGSAVADVALAGDPSVPVSVVYEDDDVIVVDKPADLVVHPGAGNDSGTLVQGLLARYPEIAGVGQPDRPGIVHRLDRGTSGLLVVARSQAAYEALVAALSTHAVEREYKALVWGHPEATSGLVDAPIGRSTREPTRMAVSNRGREARTRYDVDATFDEPVPVALLTCRLETGRTHQIRVHLQAIGHPVVGDSRYDGLREAIALRRPFLHAARLAFAHPVTGEPMSFTSPLTPDLEAVLAGLQ
jgi:23S rRNA pseudouridine1911/1915/1917 synthase